MKIVMRLEIGHMRRPNFSSIHDDAPDSSYSSSLAASSSSKLPLLSCRSRFSQRSSSSLSSATSTSSSSKCSSCTSSSSTSSSSRCSSCTSSSSSSTSSLRFPRLCFRPLPIRLRLHHLRLRLLLRCPRLRLRRLPLRLQMCIPSNEQLSRQQI